MVNAIPMGVSPFLPKKEYVTNEQKLPNSRIDSRPQIQYCGTGPNPSPTI